MSFDWFSGKLLAIESSCDETSAAVLDGPNILSNVIASQADVHQQWGGVVPEAAARMHVEAILPVVISALEQSGTALTEVGGIAVTNRPGLIGSLSVGVAAAKALAYSLDIPWLGVHHLEGHLWSVLAVDPTFAGPSVSLIVSGGHTELIHVEGFGKYRVLGQTRDDAAGEAFDKCARLLGLSGPGGVAIQNAASKAAGDAKLRLPIAKVGPTEFSFSGLKTATAHMAALPEAANNPEYAARAVQEAIVEPLVSKTMAASLDLGVETVCVVGGVSANLRLREEMEIRTRRCGMRLIVPPIALCTDNAAMIGLAGSIRLGRGESASNEDDVRSNAVLPGLE